MVRQQKLQISSVYAFVHTLYVRCCFTLNFCHTVITYRYAAGTTQITFKMQIMSSKPCSKNILHAHSNLCTTAVWE